MKKNKNAFIFSLIMALITLNIPGVHAQLNVTPGGDVGIGTTTPAAKLDVQNAAQEISLNLNNEVNSPNRVGIKNTIQDTTSGVNSTSFNFTGIENTIEPGEFGKAIGVFNDFPRNGVNTGISASVIGYLNQISPVEESSVYGGFNSIIQFNLSSSSNTNIYGNYNLIFTESGGEANGGYNIMVRNGNAQGDIYGSRNLLLPFFSGTPYTGTSYSVYASNTLNSSNPTYGVYATVPIDSNNFAGYFNGDVTITGTLTLASDAHLKENFSGINQALDKVLHLSGKRYTYKQDQEGLNLPQGTQYGFVAQEIAEVLPGLVKTTYHAGESQMQAPEGNPSTMKSLNLEPGNTEKTPDTEYQSVNYIGIIPVLVEAIKEQQQQIQTRSQENSSLRNELDAQRKINASLQRRIEALEQKVN